MIYLDNAATTKIDPEVLAEMMPYLTDQYGNAGTIYTLGREANKAVELARERVAEFLGTTPEHIIFTSGGSEANNLVFYGYPWKHILTTTIEHDSIRTAAVDLISKGTIVDFISSGDKYKEHDPAYHKYPPEDERSILNYDPLDDEGIIRESVLEKEIKPGTDLVSVMYVNNETGCVNDVCEIGNFLKEKKIMFHVDAVQAAGSIPLDVDTIGCDFLSISGHKIHAPKGVGALYVRNPSMLNPIIHGGAEQEFGKRGGTENVAGIVGMGKACSLLTPQRILEIGEQVGDLKQWFLRSIRRVGYVTKNGFTYNDSPQKILNLRFKGVDAETLILMLDAKGVCVSAGSACRSHESEPSYVLRAMGISDEDARSSIRVSFSKDNTFEEVIEAGEKCVECVELLTGRKRISSEPYDIMLKVEREKRKEQEQKKSEQ